MSSSTSDLTSSIGVLSSLATYEDSDDGEIEDGEIDQQEDAKRSNFSAAVSPMLTSPTDVDIDQIEASSLDSKTFLDVNATVDTKEGTFQVESLLQEGAKENTEPEVSPIQTIEQTGVLSQPNEEIIKTTADLHMNSEYNEIELSQEENMEMAEVFSETTSANGNQNDANRDGAGSQVAGEFNILPSEFDNSSDSDEDRNYSDEEQQKNKDSGGGGNFLVSYTAEGHGDDNDGDENEVNRRQSRERSSNKIEDSFEDDQMPPNNDQLNKTEEENEEEGEDSEIDQVVPDWLKGADLSEPNSLAALLNKVKPKREDLVLPPLPKKKCSRELQEKFEKHHAAMKMGKDFIKLVESKTEYRNPSIYEKLVEHLHINEKGSNFPKHIFNPRGFPRSAYYDELARIQNELHSKKQQQKNSPQTNTMAAATSTATTVSINSTTSNTTVINTSMQSSTISIVNLDLRRANGGGVGSEETTAGSRKTKWDMLPGTVSSNTAASTSTQIPASGPLKKQKTT